MICNNQSDNSIAENFFHTICDAYQMAEQKTVSISRFYSIGGQSIQLKFAGRSLINIICPALDHLQEEKIVKPDLIIHLWDNSETHSPVYSPFSSLKDYVQDQMSAFNNNDTRATYNINTGTLSALSISKKLGFLWVKDASRLPYYVRGAPLLPFFHWYFHSQTIQLMHASVVGQIEKGVMMVGKSGVGKSTTALSCLDSNLDYISDDYCLLANPAKPSVFSLYNSAKINDTQMLQFPQFTTSVANERSSNEKALLFLYPTYRNRVAKKIFLEAILIPRITNTSESDLTPATSFAAIKAAAPNTIMQLTNDAQLSLKLITDCFKQLPCYYLNLGTDLTSAPRLIQELLYR